jgi:hypothetical protein
MAMGTGHHKDAENPLRALKLTDRHLAALRDACRTAGRSLSDEERADVLRKVEAEIAVEARHTLRGE